MVSLPGTSWRLLITFAAAGGAAEVLGAVVVGGSTIGVLVTADEKVREEDCGGVKLAKVFELAAAVLAVTTGKFDD